MAASKYSPDLKARLAQANRMIAAEGENYAHMMQAELVELAMALSDEDHDKARSIVYDIESRAGTFDWPLVTRAAALMRELLEEGRGASPAMNVIRDSISLIVRNKMKGMPAEGMVLLETLKAAVGRELGS